MPIGLNPFTGEFNFLSRASVSGSTSFDADSGTAVPSAGVINFVGAGGASTSASGNTVTITAGGGGGVTFDDSTFRIYDDGDNTKEIAFQASGITTATTRTITMADQDINLTPTSGSFQASDADLTALAALSSTGMIARTGAATYAERTLTEGTGIDITNGDGVSGNPTITFDVTEVATIPTSVGSDSGTVTPSGNSFSIVGTNGISTSGSGATLTIDGSGAGAWRQVASATASASSTIDIVDLDTANYDYLIVVKYIIPETDATNLAVRLSDDNGSSFYSSGYTFTTYRGIGTSSGYTGSASASSLRFADGLGTASGESMSGELLLLNPSQTGYSVGCAYRTWGLGATAIHTWITGSGCNLSTTSPINGVQFLMSSGTIASGTFYVYERSVS